MAERRVERLESELSALRESLELEKTNGDAIMEVRASLKERFDAEAAFFDDAVNIALARAAKQMQDRAAKTVRDWSRSGHRGIIRCVEEAVVALPLFPADPDAPERAADK